MRRLHGRAIERAYQTGNEPMVCSHHGEESYYSRGEEKVCANCKHLDWTYNRGIPGEDVRICNLKRQGWDDMEWSLACEDYEARG